MGFTHHPHLFRVGMPDIGGRRDGDTGGIYPRFPEQRHGCHQAAITQSPNSYTFRVDKTPCHQVTNATLNIVHLNAAILFQGLPEGASMTPTAPYVDIENQVTPGNQQLVKAPGRMRCITARILTPSPLVTNGIAIGRADYQWILLRWVEIRRQVQAANQGYAIDVTVEFYVFYFCPRVGRKLW